MGGGLMQLVAYGAQDIYLTGNPQITFFKVVYRRHTNFSMESIKQSFAGNADFGGMVEATISRNGDLVHRMYLEHTAFLKAPDVGNGGTDDHIAIGCDYGSHLLKTCEIEIGGQTIDKHYGHWHSVYSQLTEFNPTGGGEADGPAGDVTLFNTMSGNGHGFEPSYPWMPQGANAKYRGWTRTSTGNSNSDAGHDAQFNGKFWIPLYFWFCRNPGLALPLIALQYHEVKIKINFENVHQLLIIGSDTNFPAINSALINSPSIVNDPSGDNKFDLWCDYIYLDTDERRRFAQVSHEYLIEQVQFQYYNSQKTMNLHFNHPVKELIWSGVRNVFTDADKVKWKLSASNTEEYTVFARGLVTLLSPPVNGPSVGGNWILKLNGHDRFKKRDYRYFTRTQLWQHHTGYGGNNSEADSIAVYSFALNPEEDQRCGPCMCSRLHTAQLIADTPTEINVYAVKYNVLRILSGMGGLAYSN